MHPVPEPAARALPPATRALSGIWRSGINTAVFCIMSALASSLVAGLADKSEKRRWGEGVPEVPSYSGVKSGVRQHQVHHGIQAGTLTPSLECDAVAWNV